MAYFTEMGAEAQTWDGTPIIADPIVPQAIPPAPRCAGGQASWNDALRIWACPGGAPPIEPAQAPGATGIPWVPIAIGAGILFLIWRS